MKKTSILIIAALLSAITTTTSYAQTNDIVAFNSTSLHLALTDVISNVSAADLTATPVAYIGSRVLKSFTKNFGAIEDAKWYSLKNKNCRADFNRDGRKTTAMFQKNGYMLYSIADGTENNVPTDIRKIVKSNYLDYNMSAIKEINTANTNAWVMNLKEDEDVVVLSVVNGSLYELQHFTQEEEKIKKVKKSRIVIPKQ